MTAASTKGGPLLRLQFPSNEIPTFALRYSYEQDEHVIKLGEAARNSGYFTRPAFLAVCAWKTERSKSRVARNSTEDVEEATRMALATKSESLRIQIPQALYGVSWATASVLLHLAHHDRYPILDYRALESLGVTGTTNYTLTFWLAYVDTCRRLADQSKVDMRTLDRALWQWSKEHSPNRT